MSRSDLYSLVRDLRQYLEWQAVPLTGAVPASDEARAEYNARLQARAEAKLRASMAPTVEVPREAPRREPTPEPATPEFRPQSPQTTQPAPPAKGANSLWKSATFGSRPQPMFEASEPAAAAETVDTIRAELGVCDRCGLSSGRKKIVFGVGDPAARLMFIGERPDLEDDRSGEPFVGDAGELLDKMIVAMGLRREDVYLTHVVKCRPPADRAPKPDEVATCSTFLARQVAAVKPEVIVALGAQASKALTGNDAALSRVRGKWHSYEGVAVMPTHHPADLLKTPKNKRDAWADLQQVMGKLGLEPPH